MELDRVLERARELESWAVSQLQEFVGIPSVSAQHRGIDEAALWVESRLEDFGFNTQRVATEGNPVVFGEYEAPTPSCSIVYYNHYDVQPEDPIDEWNTPPFVVSEQAGRLFGRGTSDNKGNLVCRLAAIKAFQDIGVDPPVTLRFVIEGEEEIGSPNLPRFMVTHANEIQSDLCIWENGGRTVEGNPEMILGCKGVMHLNLRCTTALYDMHSSQGAITPNPAWRITWALNELKGPDEAVAVDGFRDPVEPPTDRDEEIMRSIQMDEKRLMDAYGISHFLFDIQGPDLTRRLMFEPVLNINGLWGGYQGSGSKTVVPKTAGAKLDFRLVPNQTPEDIFEKIRSHLDRRGFSDVEITATGGYPPARTNPDDPAVQLVAETLRETYGCEPVPMLMMPASGPMHLFAKRMPCCGVGVGHPASRAHAPNESIYVEDLVRGIEQQVRIIHAMAEAGPNLR